MIHCDVLAEAKTEKSRQQTATNTSAGQIRQNNQANGHHVFEPAAEQEKNYTVVIVKENIRRGVSYSRSTLKHESPPNGSRIVWYTD
jgi:hypothetical protein